MTSFIFWFERADDSPMNIKLLSRANFSAVSLGTSLLFWLTWRTSVLLPRRDETWEYKYPLERLQHSHQHMFWCSQANTCSFWSFLNLICRTSIGLLEQICNDLLWSIDTSLNPLLFSYINGYNIVTRIPNLWLNLCIVF
jgi:hypothetical protein